MKRWLYYSLHFSILILTLISFQLFELLFENQIFFIMAYVWHFTLLTPGAREMMLKSNRKFSFISLVFKMNHYLQIAFVSIQHKFPQKIVNIKAPILRALSPFFFCAILIFFGVRGELFVVVLGSILFEFINYASTKIAILNSKDGF